jgi:hypothetical protein
MPAVPNTPQGEPEAAPPEAPATPEAATAAPPAAPPGQPDGLDRIYERMEEMTAQQRQMAEQFAELVAPPEEEPELYDDSGELTEEGAWAALQEAVSQQVDQRLAPLQAQALETERNQAWEDLKDDVPELGDAKYAREVIDQAVAWANAHNPDLIDRPEFVDVVEWIHKVRKYDESAAAQTPAGRGVVLESAAGAAQPSGQPEEDWGDRIVKAAERLRPQI